MGIWITNSLRGEIILHAGLDLFIEVSLSNYGFYYDVCSRSKHFALGSNMQQNMNKVIELFNLIFGYNTSLFLK